MSEALETLQMRAFLALRGGSNQPERDLAALLRSSHPIAPELREMLADALEGKGRSHTISLSAGATEMGKRVRSFGKRRNSLIRGKEARCSTAGGAGYEETLERLAAAYGVEEKTIGRDYTLAGKVAEWVHEKSNVFPDGADDSSADVSFLEAIYLGALRDKADPSERLEKMLENFQTLDVEAGLLER